MTSDSDKPRVRIPPDLKRRLSQAAKSNGRSLAAEVRHRLEVSFEAVPVAAASTPADLAPEIRNLANTLADLRVALQRPRPKKG